VIYFILTVATLIAFWRVNDCDFTVYDDKVYITENSHIQNGITKGGIRWAFTTTYAANWHPVTWISHMLDVQLFGLKPRWHHQTNLIFHIANTLLLFFVFHRMTKNLWQCTFVAALFALHPLHVESVSWVAERKDVLSTFFWMLTMGAYAYYVERPVPLRYFFIIVFFVLGLMAKPMLVTLPFVLLLLDYWPLKRFEQKKSAQNNLAKTGKPVSGDKRKMKSKKKNTSKTKLEESADYEYQWVLIRPLILEKIPLITLAVLSSIVTYIAQQKGGAVGSIEALPLSARIANALVSYVIYIGKMIWPNNLAVLYPHLGLPPLWQVVGAILFLVVVFLMLIRTAKRFQYLTMGWLWYLVTLVPVIGIVQVGVQARADRYTYVPLIGLFIVVAWGIPELVKKWRYWKEVLFVSSILIISCLFIVTWTQVENWLNSITLFEHALKVTDRNSIAHSILGVAYSEQHNYKQAIENFDKAIEIDPKNVEAYNNRGNNYLRLGNKRQAIMDFDRAIEINPKYVEGYYNRGNTYLRLGNQRQAIMDFDRAIEINPQNAKSYNNRGIAYVRLANHKHAIEDYNRAIDINPKYVEAYYNRGIAYGKLGNHKQAIEDLKTAARFGDEDARSFLRSKELNW